MGGVTKNLGPPPTAPRVGVAMTVALSMGSALAVVLSVDIHLAPAWVVLHSVLAASTTFGLALAALGVGRRLGWAVLVVVFGLLAAGTWSFVLGYSVPVTSLEGAWMWPLALGTSVGAVLAGRAAIQSR